MVSPSQIKSPGVDYNRPNKLNKAGALLQECQE